MKTFNEIADKIQPEAVAEKVILSKVDSNEIERIVAIKGSKRDQYTSGWTPVFLLKSGEVLTIKKFRGGIREFGLDSLVAFSTKIGLIERLGFDTRSLEDKIH